MGQIWTSLYILDSRCPRQSKGSDHLCGPFAIRISWALPGEPKRQAESMLVVTHTGTSVRLTICLGDVPRINAE